MNKHSQFTETYPYYDEVPYRSKGFTRLFYRFLPIPLHTYMPLRQEIYLLILRFASIGTIKKYNKQKGLRVNIGAGSSGLIGWVNIDMVKYPNVNCLFDCRKKLPFADNSVKVIFSEHFFEHLDYTEEVPFFLGDCLRVLEPGGVIRIIVPDIEKYLHAYCKEGWNELISLRPLDENLVDVCYKCQYHTKMELINMVFRQGHRHKYAYDYKTLKFILYRSGFSEVVKQHFKKSMMKELCIDKEERASESLYVEAVK